MRGREVGRQPLERELEPGVEHRRADALARLAHRAVRQSDDGERRETAAEVDLDRDLTRSDSLDGECGDAREHAGKLDRATAHVCDVCDNFVTPSCRECKTVPAAFPSPDWCELVTQFTHVLRRLA